MRECGLTAGLTSNETTRSEVSLRSEFDQTLIERSAHKYRYANLTMISPADALKMTLQSQAAGAQQVLESTEFDLACWMTKHVPPAFTVPFAALGADDFEDLLGLTEPDLADIAIPPLKRRRILRQIQKDRDSYGFGKPSHDCHDL